MWAPAMCLKIFSMASKKVDLDGEKQDASKYFAFYCFFIYWWLFLFQYHYWSCFGLESVWECPRGYIHRYNVWHEWFLYYQYLQSCLRDIKLWFAVVTFFVFVAFKERDGKGKLVLSCISGMIICCCRWTTVSISTDFAFQQLHCLCVYFFCYGILDCYTHRHHTTSSIWKCCYV